MGKGRSTKEVAQIVADFERSGLNRREYSEKRGIPVVTLDWYRRRVRTSRSSPNLLAVNITRAAPPMTRSGADETAGFALVLASGHRIEARWNFSDDAMRRLIRIAGAA